MKSIITKSTNSCMTLNSEGEGIPVHTDGNYAISTWRLSFWERILVLITGRVYVKLFIGGQSMQPHRASVV